jgi:hypothetical protein
MHSGYEMLDIKALNNCWDSCNTNATYFEDSGLLGHYFMYVGTEVVLFRGAHCLHLQGSTKGWKYISTCMDVWYSVRQSEIIYQSPHYLVPEDLLFFFLLGPIKVNAPVCTAAFEAYCAALNTKFSQITQPCASYKEAEVLYCGCTDVCWFNHQAPKDIIASASQCLAAACNMLYCFNLLPAESAGRIPFKQTHST